MENNFTVTTCPVCGKIISFGSKQIEQVNGFAYEIKFSENGWGHAQTMGSFSDEICLECFEQFVIHIERFLAAVESRRGINKEQLQIMRQGAPVEVKAIEKPADDFRPVKVQVDEVPKTPSVLERFIEFIKKGMK